jgi:hypothetical protein
MNEADWRLWLADLVKAGAAEFDAEPVGECVIGLRARTAGSRVVMAADRSVRWLRIVPARPGWAGGPMWTANADAGALVGVARPEVLGVSEREQDGFLVRAELMTLAPGEPIAPGMALRAPVTLPPSWWADLRRSLDNLAASPTDRTCLDADLVRLRLLAMFGVEIDPDTIEWSTAHGDLHWANLTGPTCCLLDWEAWGTAPAGYDAATLYCASLLRPEIAAQVAERFGGLLDSPAGAVAHLSAAAKFLGLVEYGDHPDLAVPLHRHARQVMRRFFPKSLRD